MTDRFQTYLSNLIELHIKTNIAPGFEDVTGNQTAKKGEERSDTWHAKCLKLPPYKRHRVERRVRISRLNPRRLKKSASFEQPNRTHGTSAGQACKSELVVKSIKEAVEPTLQASALYRSRYYLEILLSSRNSDTQAHAGLIVSPMATQTASSSSFMEKIWKKA